MRKFIVKGTAFAPIEVAMQVWAEDEREAEASALKTFNEARNRSQWVVPGSVDESHVYDWAPFAEPAQPLTTSKEEKR